ncbi:MAG: acyl-CoA dehydrogenase [Myxococcales bacterium]|nr:acyl-CoA dehydrogenase [Myxococcales bacterium]
MSRTAPPPLPRSPFWQTKSTETKATSDNAQSDGSAVDYAAIDYPAIVQSVHGFVVRDVMPHLESWEQQGFLPDAIYLKAAAVGLIPLGYPEQYGGVPCNAFARIASTRALCEAGSGGLFAGLLSHGIALPPLLALGSDDLCQRIAPAVLKGTAKMALAVTEPTGGSDVANLRTTAVLDGDHYVVNGDKAFITTGMRADWLTVAVRTGEKGAGGVSLLMVEGDRVGIGKTALNKMGWLCSDTALLHFDNVRVPASHLVGGEGLGFLGLMHNFNIERLGLASLAWGMAEVCWTDAVDWARGRETFGKPLVTRQVIRHKLVDLRSRIDAVRCVLEQVAWRIDQGDEPVAEVCMLKNQATATLEHVAGEVVQILGGAGYIRGCRAERIFRETKVLSIGGGASEVLADLAARQLGF